MKYMFFTFFIFVSLSLFAKDLTCSKNGTSVFYINGVLAKSEYEIAEDKTLIDLLYKNEKGLLDKQGAVNFNYIYNPSNGVLNDIAELYAEDYFYRTGKNDGFKVFRENIIFKLKQAQSPSRLKKLFNWKYLKQLELKSERILALAKERDYLLHSPEKLGEVNANIVNKVIKQIDDSVRAQKKILLVGHSQGNAIFKEAFKRISTNSVDYQNFIKNYVGVFHVASPVQNVSSEVTNVRSLLLSNDWIVNLANYIFPEFNQSPSTHELISTSLNQSYSEFDEFNHMFSTTYVNPNIKARSLNDFSIKTMDTVFKETLSDLATDLKNNCFDFDLESSITGNVETGFKDYGEFPYKGKVNFSLKLSDAFELTDSVVLYRTDTNEPLTPNFSITFSSGGTYTLPLKLVRLNGGEPILKTVKITISPRLQLKPKIASCAVWGGGTLNYFSFDGTIAGWGFQKIGNGSIYKYTVDGLEQRPYLGSGYEYYPELLWLAGATYQRSAHITIEDSVGVIFDSVVTNPCEPYMVFLDENGFIPIVF